MLKNGRMNAGEIAEQLDITPAALSYHLKLLKGADLVMEYKQKNFIYYEINTSVFDELIMWIISIVSLVGTAFAITFLPEQMRKKKPVQYQM
ncbi:MAG: ArsR family transcriptional regulator [Acetatifactor sp.]|nr:ArsR family transcriptional regulator [Acetatifactor sp.]